MQGPHSEAVLSHHPRQWVPSITTCHNDARFSRLIGGTGGPVTASECSSVENDNNLISDRLQSLQVIHLTLIVRVVCGDTTQPLLTSLSSSRSLYMNLVDEVLITKGSFTIVNIFSIVQRVLILRPPLPLPKLYQHFNNSTQLTSAPPPSP